MAIRRNYPIIEAAPLLGLKLNTTRQFVTMGLIESVQIGRKRLIPEHVIERICSEGLDTSAAAKKKAKANKKKQAAASRRAVN